MVSEGYGRYIVMKQRGSGQKKRAVDEQLPSLKKSTRSARQAVEFDPVSLDEMARDRHAWYETQEEIEAGLEWGRRKADLLHWVRRQMGRRLTHRERRCIELRFFRGKNYREVGEYTGTSASASQRAVSRGLRKLREAAKEDRVREQMGRKRRP